MHQAKRGYVGYLLLIVMLLTASPLLAAAAAKVEFVWGMAYAVSISGEKRELEKGSRIDVGDTVVSKTARVQLRFTDGGFVSLAPHSEFRVNAYSYSGKPDGSERIAMELMKGGLRTISGLIGKAIQSAYEMKTAVGTIGIRGTEYTVVYGESVSGTVSAGAIAVCNAGGCLDVAHGQSYYIKDENTKPVFISKAALLSPRQPVIAGERNRDKVAEGENTGAKSEKGKTRSSRGNDLSSWRGDSQRGKEDAPKGGRGYDALSFPGNDDRGQRAHESLLTTGDGNSQHGNDATSHQTQAGDTLTAVALGNSPLRVDDSPVGFNGNGPGNSFATANEHSRFAR
jgi:FecR protein